MEADKYDELHKQQDLIVRMMKMLGNEEKKEDYLTMECEAKNGIEIIRKIVNMTKKSVSQTAED